MKNKGFTLVEILGVIVIVGLLLLLIVPNIVSKIGKGKSNVTKVTKDIIYNASSQYIKENKEIYKVGEYCITIEQLVNDEKLQSPVKDVTGEINNGNILDKDYAVHAKIGASGNEEYELEEKTTCIMALNAPKPKIYVDEENVKVRIEWPEVGEGTEYPYEIEGRSYSIPNDDNRYQVTGNAYEKKTVEITADPANTPHLTKSGQVTAYIKYKDLNEISTSRTVNISGVKVEFTVANYEKVNENPITPPTPPKKITEIADLKKWIKNINLKVSATSKYGIKEKEDNGNPASHNIYYKWIKTDEYDPNTSLNLNTAKYVVGDYENKDSNPEINYKTISKTIPSKNGDQLLPTGEYYLVIGQGVWTKAHTVLDTDVISDAVKIDNTAPNVPTIINSNGNKYTNGSISLTVESKDEHSGMGKFQYTYNANATNYQSGSNDQTQWKDLTGCNNKDKCKTEPWSASRNQTTYIRACDKVGNCSGKSSTKIMIDKVVPTCTVKKTTTDSPNGVSVTITCSDPKINGQDGSGIKTCAGVNGATATKTGLKSSQTYQIVDNVGNKGTCKVTINSRKQYARRHCNQCKSCSSAGCASYGSWVCTRKVRKCPKETQYDCFPKGAYSSARVCKAQEGSSAVWMNGQCCRTYKLLL